MTMRQAGKIAKRRHVHRYRGTTLSRARRIACRMANRYAKDEIERDKKRIDEMLATALTERPMLFVLRRSTDI